MVLVVAVGLEGAEFDEGGDRFAVGLVGAAMASVGIGNSEDWESCSAISTAIALAVRCPNGGRKLFSQ